MLPKSTCAVCPARVTTGIATSFAVIPLAFFCRAHSRLIADRLPRNSLSSTLRRS